MNGAGSAEGKHGQWERADGEKNNWAGSEGSAAGTAPLFARLSAAFRNNDVLISDTAAWSGFDRPDKSFGDYWQDEGGLPEVARVAIESVQKFAGSVVVAGMTDTTIPGVMALLRNNGHLTVMCVVDRPSGRDIEMHVDVERARKVTCKLALDYCVDDAILLFHVNARRTNLRDAFVSMGIPRADASTLYALQDAQRPTLSVGWIASA
jgi:hypothetical protein